MKNILRTSVFLLVALTSFTASTEASSAGKVLIIINEGFQPEEFLTPRKRLLEAGYEITVASRFGGTVHAGAKYTDVAPVQADLRFDDVKVTDYKAISFTGGGGAWSDYFPEPKLHRILREGLADKELVIGLICAGTGVLATFDNLDGQTPKLKGRHVTGYREVEGLLKTQGKLNYDGGDPKKPYAVTDGNLITGRDPSSAEMYVQAILKRLRR